VEPLSPDEAARALGHVDPHERDTWVAMGMALASEFGDAGFPIWDEWSQGAGNYDAGAAKTTWRSFRAGSIRIGTLIAEAKRHGYQPTRRELTAEERRQAREEQRRRREEAAGRIEADQAAAAAWHQRIAVAVDTIRREYLTRAGAFAPYLSRKGVAAHGVGALRCGVVVVTDIEAERVDFITSRGDITNFFAQVKRGEWDRERKTFRYLKRGTLAVPMRDADGQLWSCQFIAPDGGKAFFKFGRMSGLFHWIGPDHVADPVVAIAEGYATAATIHEATGWPAVCAFNAGNLVTVAQSLRERYPAARLIVCGDDDNQNEKNPGRQSAQRAADAVGGVAVFPQFPELESATDE